MISNPCSVISFHWDYVERSPSPWTWLVYNSIFLLFWQSTTIAKQSRESNLIPRALSNLSPGGQVGQEPGKEVAKKEQPSICDKYVVFMLIICLSSKKVCQNHSVGVLMKYNSTSAVEKKFCWSGKIIFLVLNLLQWIKRYSARANNTFLLHFHFHFFVYFAF